MKTIRLDGVIGWDVMAGDIARQIEDEKEVNIVINSGGGDILEGFSIYNILDGFDGFIQVQVDFAASMASVIAMAADRVVMKEDSSIMMIHRPWGGASGNSEDLRRTADTLDKLEENLINIYMRRASVDRNELVNLLDEETYLDAREAKALGLADEIDSGKVDMALVAMAGMKAHEKVNFSTGKFLAKIESVKSEKKPIRDLFNHCASLADVETVMRNELKLSRSEALAISAAVKKQVQGDLERNEILDIFNNFLN